jgi:hypothetical protein
MKLKSLVFLFVFAFNLFGCKSDQQDVTNEAKEYTPIDESLYKIVLSLDETFFNAYNTCDLDLQKSMYSDDLEFFHDKNGLSTSKEEILEGTKRHICGKVTRELIQGSVEVYPINNYGAVQIGYHKFHNKEEPDAESVPSKFIAMWHNDNDNWKLAKVISLH